MYYLWLQNTVNLYGEFVTETEVADFLIKNGWSEKTNLPVKSWALTVEGNAHVVTISNIRNIPTFLNKDLLPKGVPPKAVTTTQKFFEDHFQII